MWFHNNQKKTQSYDAHDFHINMWKSMHHDQTQPLNFPLLINYPSNYQITQQVTQPPFMLYKTMFI